jgi:hypothetical protein
VEPICLDLLDIPVHLPNNDDPVVVVIHLKHPTWTEAEVVGLCLSVRQRERRVRSPLAGLLYPEYPYGNKKAERRCSFNSKN